MIGALVCVAGCGQSATRATGQARPSSTVAITGMAAAVPSRGAACVFVKPDGAQRFGHAGWAFKVPGTGRWVYGAVENPSAELYTRPGGDIGPRAMIRTVEARGFLVGVDRRPASSLQLTPG
ncbi:hypothetical protein ABZT06_10955 [Streptomyces sp. NPDC005483]|uniref:hypothetical protein n=1 Tax=Streptomyces sp. NPDC005483 TaxID=3154882 RepID=UPI0033B9D497